MPAGVPLAVGYAIAKEPLPQGKALLVESCRPGKLAQRATLMPCHLPELRLSCSHRRAH